MFVRYNVHMKQEEFQKLEHDKKVDEIYKSVEKTRKYFKWTLIVSLVVIILPLLFLPLVISRFLGAYDFGALGL